MPIVAESPRPLHGREAVTHYLLAACRRVRLDGRREGTVSVVSVRGRGERQIYLPDDDSRNDGGLRLSGGERAADGEEHRGPSHRTSRPDGDSLRRDYRDRRRKATG